MHKNENRPGYKKTKVGWIPEGWEETSLEKICELQSGKFITASAISEERQNDAFPCFGGNGLRGYVDSYSHDGDYPLIGRQGALCGNVCWASGKFYATEHAVVATPADHTASKWLYYKLDHLNLNKYATGVAQPGLSVQVLNKVMTPAPPLPEQEAIAEVLECWDKGIRTLEKKIEKKRLIKKGLMQQLLAGTLRLPSFGAECRVANGGCRVSKDWKTVKLGKICDILDNQRKPINSEERNLISGDIPYYGANGIVGYVNDYIFDEELILLAEDGGHFEEYETRPIAQLISGKTWVNNHAHVIRAKNRQNKFLFYSLVHKNILQFLNGGTRAKLNKSELEVIPVSYPEVEEQRAIAEVLSAADREIEALEKKLALWKEQKKYLLNNLVTGTLRLPEFRKDF